MKELKLNRSLLSGYYVSILISFFLFQLIKESIVNLWTTWFISFLAAAFKINATTSGATWLSLVFICFIVVFVIRRFVVEVLNLYSDNESYKPWESGVLLILVAGYFIYVVNKVFSQPMPSAWFPDFLVKLLGGNGEGIEVVALSVEEKNAWTIVPWLWTIGPVAFMYFRTIASKFKSGEK